MKFCDFFSGHCDLDLWPKVTNFNRVWINAKRNCLVKTPSNSAYRFDQHFVHKFRHVSGYCDLDIWPKVTKFNRVRASARGNHLAKTASKSVHSFVWNFVHKKCRTHRHTDKLKWKYNPSTISWRCKNKNNRDHEEEELQKKKNKIILLVIAGASGRSVIVEAKNSTVTATTLLCCFSSSALTTPKTHFCAISNDKLLHSKYKKKKNKINLNKQHSENTDTSMSVTFDLVVWPFVKVKKADVIRCRLLYCTLVPGMMSMYLILYEISPFVYFMWNCDLKLLSRSLAL